MADAACVEAEDEAVEAGGTTAREAVDDAGARDLTDTSAGSAPPLAANGAASDSAREATSVMEAGS